MPSVYDIGGKKTQTKHSFNEEDDDYRYLYKIKLIFHNIWFFFNLFSKDRFDEGSISYDDGEKVGIHQEDSVLSDSAVIVEGEEAIGDHRSVVDDDIEDDYDDDDDDNNNNPMPSKSKVFEFSSKYLLII